MHTAQRGARSISTLFSRPKFWLSGFRRASGAVRAKICLILVFRTYQKRISAPMVSLRLVLCISCRGWKFYPLLLFIWL